MSYLHFIQGLKVIRRLKAREALETYRATTAAFHASKSDRRTWTLLYGIMAGHHGKVIH